jgi:hypothetical protein
MPGGIAQTCVQGTGCATIIRARNSAGYGGRLFGIVDSPLPSDEVSTKPGQLHTLLN